MFKYVGCLPDNLAVFSTSPEAFPSEVVEFAPFDGNLPEGGIIKTDGKGLVWVVPYEDPSNPPATPPLPPPLTNEALTQENKLLKAQVQTLSDRGDFLEECLVEMAGQVY